VVISRAAIIPIIAGTITADTVTAFSIRATIPITGTKGRDPVSRFRSINWRMPDFTRSRETNSGDARFVPEA
jgi:hypothetical protein